jgi:hypothetical protein
MSSAQHFVLHFTDEGPTVLTMVTVFARVFYGWCLLLTGTVGKRDDHTRMETKGSQG